MSKQKSAKGRRPDTTKRDSKERETATEDAGQGSASPSRSGSQTAPSNAERQPIAYYDSNRSRFYTLSSGGDWIAFTEGSLKRRLRWEIYRDEKDDDLRGALIQQHLMRLQIDENVVYAGPLAGHQRGIHIIDGHKFLITSGPRLIIPRKGTCPTLGKFIDELLGENQYLLYSWLKCSLETLRKGPPFRPGQMFALAGPSGCGKSLLQDILTEIFGGRFAKPYDWLIGQEKWNDDMLGAEHLMIEDDASSTDYRSRRSFGAKLKNLVANQTQMLKRRFADAIAVRTFGRVTITLNEEPESLMVMPPIDESLADKIIFVRASRATFPFDDNDLEARAAFRKQITKELPAFLDFLDRYEIPTNMRDQRYGVKGYQEPSLMRDLNELTPEEELLAFIDSSDLWILGSNSWTGTAAQLQTKLKEFDKTGRLKEILTFSTACGAFLARLMRIHPDRIAADRNGGKTREWTIMKPK